MSNPAFVFDFSHTDRSAMMPTYAPPEILFTHGEGAYLYTEDNTAYLDFISGIAVTALGHCHPHLVRALHAQVDKLWHVSNLFRVPQAEYLAERLVESTFADKVFFANSGAEAVECGLKMMRRYHFDRGQPERYRIIGTNNSFHGRTLATIAAAGSPKYTTGFIQGDPGYDHVGFNDIDAIKAAITEKTAGIIVEPVQGEGGIWPAGIEYLKELRQLCDDHGILLMFDEIQCGMGRSGKLFAYQHYGVNPDIMSIAKGLGGGFPVGACVATDKVAEHMVVGTHGTTFGGNPLAMTVANAVMDVINEPAFLQQVGKASQILRSALLNLQQQYPNIILEVRGLGLMLGMACEGDNAAIIKLLREQQLLVGRAGSNVVRLLPPLIIQQAHVDEAVNKFHTVFANMAQG